MKIYKKIKLKATYQQIKIICLIVLSLFYFRTCFESFKTKNVGGYIVQYFGLNS